MFVNFISIFVVIIFGRILMVELDYRELGFAYTKIL